MFSKKWMINILLTGLVIFLGIKAYDAASMKATIPPAAAVDSPTPAVAPVAIAVKDEVAASTYDLIVAKNLFAPEREEIIPAPPEPKKSPQKKKPEITKADKRLIARLSLIGVVLSEGRKAALVQGAAKGTKRGGVQWVVEGDEIGGMQISEIRDEKVLLTSGDEVVEILLYDSGKAKKRGGGNVAKSGAQPTVLTTGSAGTSTAAAPQKAVSPKEGLSAKKQPQKTKSDAQTRRSNRLKNKAARKSNQP